MDEDNLEELLATRLQGEQDLEKLRAPMTILFSDIKGSTRYAEKRGDVEYMAMINRHNRILFPVIEAEGGSVVKTIGDSILAKFDEPSAGVKAAVGMQRALAKDAEGREEIEQIRVRIGLHHGMGLLKDNDVYGDVVNAASRIEHQAEAEQILITDALLDAATTAGFECAKMGRAELRGKDEPIDLYAVAWSHSATQQLIQEVEAKYEKRIKEIKKEQAGLEAGIDKARDQWRTERRALNAEIERLEDALDRAMETARHQVSEELQSQLRFQIEELHRSRDQVEQDLASARQKFEAEKNNLKAQIAAVEATVVDAMERLNNPSRLAAAVREQVQARLADAKQEWQLEWEADRKRLLAENERLKKSSLMSDEKKAAARRLVLEKLGKLPPGSGGAAAKTADQWERDFEDAKIQWEGARQQLALRINKLETELESTQESVRSQILEELKAQHGYDLAESRRQREQLEQDIQFATGELAGERQRLNARIKNLEESLPAAQESARKQALAELQAEFDVKLEEAARLRARMERKQQDQVLEWEAERRSASKKIAMLEEQLREAKEAAFKAQKSFGQTTE
jgi:class 3 adenylate cyclase